MYDLVTVGHFTEDLIISPTISCPAATVGGPPTFVSVAASKLGAKVSAISKVGADFQRHFRWLRENSVNLTHTKVVHNGSTTRFTLTYTGRNEKRELRLLSQAPEISLLDVPTQLQTKAIHVAPVADELSPDMIQPLRERASMLSVDPQGFLREFTTTGYAQPKQLRNLDFLHDCSVFKSTAEEIATITGQAEPARAMKEIRKHGAGMVLVTMGRRGVTAYVGQKMLHVPSCQSKRVKDSTGAGDVFIGAFLAEFLKGREPLWCCCVGSSSASFIVEEVGPKGFGEKNEVYERATEIYEKRAKRFSKWF